MGGVYTCPSPCTGDHRAVAMLAIEVLQGPYLTGEVGKSVLGC